MGVSDLSSTKESGLQFFLNLEESVLFDSIIGPACLLTFTDSISEILRVNDKFLKEILFNGTAKDFCASNGNTFFMQHNSLFIETILKAIETDREQTITFENHSFSQCCGIDKSFLRMSFQSIAAEDEKYIIFSTVQNVTEEINRLDQISESEEKFRNAAEQANVYAWEYDIKTKNMYPCIRCMRDLGLPSVVANYPEPAIEAGIFPPEVADYYRDMMRQIDGGIPSIEGIIPLTPNRIPFFVRYNTIFDKNGSPVKAFGSATLVINSEKETLFQEIVQTLSRDYLDVISVDPENDTCSIIKAEGTFFDKKDISPNPDFKYSFSSQVEKYTSGQVLDNDKELLKKAMSPEIINAELENSSDYTYTYCVVTSNEKHHMQFRFFRPSGKDFVICAFQNVDDAVERQRKQSEMLETALDSAKRANAAKTIFLSHMSHDIRTPMNGIIGLIDMEERHPDDAALVKTNRAKMKIAANHLLSLINDVLDLSKMEDENTVLNSEPFDIKQIYSDVLSIAGMRASEDGITLSSYEEETAFNNSWVYGSPLHVRKILLNIVNNCIKYNKKNGSVKCEVKSETKNNKAYFTFTISDTGIGMSDEFQKRMFEPFSQEKSDSRSVFQGTGLGMSIVKSLLNKMNGTIDVWSKVNIGSKFEISIPFDIAPNIQEETTEDKSESFSLENTKILLVEDNELNMEIATMLLEDCGAVVTVVTDGLQAVNIVSENPQGRFDLILMDVMMPVMDGLEATRQIRKLNRPDAATIPIVAMTANAFADDIIICKESGMNSHIAKPINIETAMATISECLQR